MKLLAAFVAVALAIVPVPPPGQVSGDVRDPDGLLVPGATVAISSASMARRTVTTDSVGQFEIADLAAGDYELTATLQGFKTFTRRFQLVDGERVRTSIPLVVGSLTEVVNVTAVRPANAAPVVTPAQGALGGVPSPAPLGLPPAAPAARDALVGGKLQEPRKTQNQAPVYPAAAVETGVTGTVIVKATVSADGGVKNATMVKSVALLDAAVLDALRGWRYTPVRLNGKAIDVDLIVGVNFTLK